MQLNATSPSSPSALQITLLSAALALPAVHDAHAESAPERGSVSFKLLDYLDSQPDAERVRVRAPSLGVLVPLGSDWSLSGSVISDGISGASPAYHSTALSKLHDRRRAADVSATRYWSGGSWTLGANISSESDYLSRGLSLQATRDSEDKNTTWSAGLAFSNDAINPSNHVVSNERKRVAEVLVGVTQVLGTHDIAQLNLGYSRGSGYFSDPYKQFDNRPREKNHRTLLARWNHHVDATEGTARLSYRYYADSYGIKAHTFGLEYVQPLPAGWTLTPLLRVYTQSAARFYFDAEAEPGPFGPTPPEGAVYTSADQRVSAFGARTWGIKLAKQLGADWLLDVKFERYGQRAGWRLFGTGSPNLAPFNARMVQIGVSRAF